MNKLKIILILLFLVIPALASAEEYFPFFPMSFYGRAELNGASLSAGSKIQVFAGGTLKGEAIVDVSGYYGENNPTKSRLIINQYSGNELIFKYVLNGSNEPITGDTTVKYEGGFESGKTIQFDLPFVKNVQITVTPNSSSGGGGGGGGGGASIIYCSSVVYEDWGDCVSGVQARDIASKIPTYCVLTSAQESAKTQTCSSAAQATSTASETSHQQVLGAKIISDIYNEVLAMETSLLAAIDKDMVKRLSGYILLQVENNGEAWYVSPIDQKKYYLQNGAVAYEALRSFGLGITDADLNKIPVGIENRFSDVDSDQDGLPDKLEEGLKIDPAKPDTDGDGVSDGDEVLKNGTNPLGTGKINYDKNLADRLKGRILLQVQSRGEAWYVNPKDGKRYYMKNGDAAYQIMRFLSLGITNANLRKIGVGDLFE